MQKLRSHTGDGWESQALDPSMHRRTFFNKLPANDRDCCNTFFREFAEYMYGKGATCSDDFDKMYDEVTHGSGMSSRRIRYDRENKSWSIVLYRDSVPKVEYEIQDDKTQKSGFGAKRTVKRWDTDHNGNAITLKSFSVSVTKIRSGGDHDLIRCVKLDANTMILPPFDDDLKVFCTKYLKWLINRLGYTEFNTILSVYFSSLLSIVRSIVGHISDLYIYSGITPIYPPLTLSSIAVICEPEHGLQFPILDVPEGKRSGGYDHAPWLRDEHQILGHMGGVLLLEALMILLQSVVTSPRKYSEFSANVKSIFTPPTKEKESALSLLFSDFKQIVGAQHIFDLIKSLMFSYPLEFEHTKLKIKHTQLLYEYNLVAQPRALPGSDKEKFDREEKHVPYTWNSEYHTDIRSERKATPGGVAVDDDASDLFSDSSDIPDIR